MVLVGVVRKMGSVHRLRVGTFEAVKEAWLMHQDPRGGEGRVQVKDWL